MSQDGYSSLRETAGLIRRRRGLVGFRGPDRHDYLQGQLTNDIAGLPDGSACYAAHLTPSGRIIADMDVLSVGDDIFLDVDGSVKDSLVARFQDLIFTEDLEITDWTDAHASYVVSGPLAPRLVGTALEQLGGESLAAVAKRDDHWVLRPPVGNSSLLIARTDPLGTLGLTLWVERTFADDLESALAEAGCTSVADAVANVVRIENGYPVFPSDLGDDIIPLEAGIEDRAISFTKGCYVGQEVIIRILHRGQGRVARRLTGLTTALLDPADGPVAGATLWKGEKDVGRLTSVALSPRTGTLIALGYVARSFLGPGSELEASTPSGRCSVVVTKLPFPS